MQYLPHPLSRLEMLDGNLHLMVNRCWPIKYVVIIVVNLELIVEKPMNFIDYIFNR